MNEPASPTTPESPTNPESTAPWRPLRIWPAVVLLAGLWVIKVTPYMIEDITPGLFMASVFAPIVCAFLILLWWCGFSRASTTERAIGLIGVLAVGIITSVTVDKSLQGFGILMYVIPWGITSFTAALIVGFWLKPPLRVAVALTAAMVGFGFWDLVRSDGVWGDFRSTRAWRWSPTSEDLFMASLESRQPTAEEEVDSVDFSNAPWPSFRGAKQDAIVTGLALEEDWDANPPKELWRIKCGPAWSSFTVAGDRLFTQEQRGDNEVVVCYDAENGAELWTAEYPSRFWEAVAGAGPRATPTFHEGKVYALGAEGVLHRIDAATGEIEWKQDLREIREPPMWGFSSSPLVVNGSVIVHAGGENDEGIVAFDVESGKKTWCAPSGNHSYSSPQILEVNGQPQLLMVCNDGLTAYDPANGEVLWKHTWEYEGYRVLQPLQVDSSSFVIGTGMGTGTRRIDVAFEGDEPTTSERWTTRNIKPDYNDYVAHEGHLYGFDRNIFACIDLETGDRDWKKGRYGHGQVLLLPEQDQLLVLSESGELVLLRATPERLEELAKVPAIEGKTWNHPVLVGDRLYLRNGEEAACYQVPLQPQATPEL